HAGSNCPKSVKSVSNSNEKREEVVQNQNIDTGKEDKEGFVEVKSRKNGGIDNKVKRPNFRANPQNNKYGSNVKNVYQAKNKTQEVKEKTPIKVPEKDTKDSPNVKNDKGSGSEKENSETSTKKWSVHKDILEAMKRSANKYTIFEMYDDIDMVAYYKQKKEVLVDKGEWFEEEDVLEEVNDIAKNMQGNVVKGMEDGVCAILETQLKSKRINDVCDRIYGRWSWITNMRHCNKGCRIMIGWNEDAVSIFVDHMARQSMLRLVGTISWFLSGDMNVTLAPNEHSVGGSNVSSDMKEFHNCVNNIEMEDINSSGLFYTWTKNLHNVIQGGQTENEEIEKAFKEFGLEEWGFFENVKKLREAVKEVQVKIDKDPHNHELRSEEVGTLKAYTEALKEEELILYQKAKVKWLSVGDRNNAYFHKAIKSRQQRNRVDVICNENGERFEGSVVAQQFSAHWLELIV
ncbi:hypothetical protein Tco_1424514, partial [Tanacetum coccineum]